MEILHIVLYPLIVIMELMFNILTSIFLHYPLIVIFIFAVLIILMLRPLQKPLRKIEIKTTEIIKLIEDEYREKASGLSKEEQFFLRDRLYKKYSYNPFQSFKQAISFFALMPFLISVIIIFQESLFFQSSRIFGVLLSEPDRLLAGYNVLPGIMFLSTYLDSRFRYANDPASRNKFLVISLVLFFLVYNLSSALIIFWISMNLINMTYFYLSHEN
ncbi:YidC/Oxa1 family membrane protein insertase [Gammaproteobacteria bacterium]|nr:YidC/Oxa1 family membrane protein insertase [Gammaproteobacteria bacterium]MDC1325987.1 YidC/Oxa1 family membrane protein insertase [Gammaproteobacteria bacterium]